MTSNQTQVLELYTAMFNRAADISGLNYWVNLMDQNNWSILDVAQSFSVQNEYTALYPTSQNLDAQHKRHTLSRQKFIRG